jgi:hypothetical protein
MCILPKSALITSCTQWLDSTAARRCFTTHRGVMYTMIRLAISAMQLPSRLYVRGVDIGAGRVDPAECGGFADIFVGKYGGHYVAVKRFRSHRARDGDLFKVRSRGHYLMCSPLIPPLESVSRGACMATAEAPVHSPFHWYRQGHLRVGRISMLGVTLDAARNTQELHQLHRLQRL